MPQSVVESGQKTTIKHFRDHDYSFRNEIALICQTAFCAEFEFQTFDFQ